MKYASCLVGVAAALLGLGSSLFGQDPVPLMQTPLGSVPAPAAVDGAAPGGGAAAYPPGVSSWLAYPRGPRCCDEVGKHGPVMSETYARAGASQPLGTNRFSTNANTGLAIGAGWRTLLFNPEFDRAWVVDFAIRSTWWSITNGPSFTLLDTPLPESDFQGRAVRGTQVVTPIRWHHTTFDASLGQECYLWGTAACDGTAKCRVGWDFGGRWGSSRLDFAVLRHRTDVIGGFFTAVHTDYECPFGCCMFHAGLRLEYGYTFSDILQSRNDTDWQTVNAMVTAGLRF